MPSALISDCESEKQSTFPTGKIFDNPILRAQETGNASKEMSSTIFENHKMSECNDINATQTIKITCNAFDAPTPMKVNKFNSINEAGIIVPEVPINNGINHICALEPTVTKLAELAAIPDIILHTRSEANHDTESNANQESLEVTSAILSKIKNAYGSHFKDSNFSVSPTAESLTSKVKRSRGRPKKILKSSMCNRNQYLSQGESDVDSLKNDNNMKIFKSNQNILCLNKIKSANCDKRATKRLKLNKDEISSSTKFLPSEAESIAAEVSYVLNVSQFDKSNEIKHRNLFSGIISSSENHEFSDNHTEVVKKTNNVISEVKKPRGRPRKKQKKAQIVKVPSVDNQMQNILNTDEVDISNDESFGLKNVSNSQNTISKDGKLPLSEKESSERCKLDVSKNVEIKKGRGRRRKNQSTLSDSKVSTASRPLPKKASKLKMPKKKSVKPIKDSVSKVSLEDQFFKNKISKRTGHAVKRSLKVKKQKEQVKRNRSEPCIPDAHITPCLEKSYDSKYKEKSKNSNKKFKNIVIHINKEKKLVSKKKVLFNFEKFRSDKTSKYFMDSVNLSDFQPKKEDSLKANEVSTKSCEDSKKSNHTLKNSLSADLLPQYKPQKCLWMLLNEKDSGEYCPLMKFSPYFKTKRTWNGEETSWKTLKPFESEPLDDESCHYTFFTGGSVLCAAWCPIPGEGINEQYIAIAVNISVDKYHKYECLDTGKCLIQLWNVGVLNCQKLKSKPAVELIIAQDHGIITDMKWCPSGCWEDSSKDCSDDILPRLGILAVAFSDSYVRIYSIPHPLSLTSELTFSIYETSPSIILQPLFGNNCRATEKTMCVSLEWQKSDLCERVAAGYGNGIICVWHINSTSVLLVSKENNATKMRPYLVFKAHGTPVTSLSFSPIPGGRFLLSSSYDKTLKFWDLTNISLPFHTLRKGIVMCADWANSYCGAFSSLDHGMNLRDACFFQECGLEKFGCCSLSTPNRPTTKISICKFFNAIAMVDKSGSLSVSFYRNLLDDIKAPHYFHRPVYQTEIAPVQGIERESFVSCLSEEFNNCNAPQEIQDIVLSTKEVIGNTSLEESSNHNFVTETTKSKTQEARSFLLSNSTSTDQRVESKTSPECRNDLLPSDTASLCGNYKAVCDISMDSESTTEYNNETFTQAYSNKQSRDFNEVLKSVVPPDSASSNSEAEFNVIDREMAESSVLDEKLELSNDSIISECSLTSNMKIDSPTDESNFSDKIYMTQVEESKSQKMFLCSNSNSPSKVSSQSSDSEIVVSEKCENFPSKNNEESGVLKNKAVFCENQVENFRNALSLAKEDKSCSKAVANNYSTIFRNLDEVNSDSISSDLSSGAFNNVQSVSGSIPSSHFEMFQNNNPCTSDILTNYKCDKACDSATPRNKFDFSNTCFAANPDEKKANSLNMCFQNKMQNNSSETNLISKVAEKCIFETEKSPDLKIKSNCDKNNENESVPYENSSIFDSKALISTLYTSTNKEYHRGLIFKDMNTADFENIGDEYLKEDNRTLFEEDPILSMKAVAWNPNYGSHSWIISACHSGFARLSYIADMEWWKDKKKVKKDFMMH